MSVDPFANDFPTLLIRRVPQTPDGADPDTTPRRPVVPRQRSAARSGFAVAIGAALGAGTAAAGLTGAASTPAHPENTSAPELAANPVTLPAPREPVGENDPARGAAVAADDLHRGDARQIAALSRSVHPTEPARRPQRTDRPFVRRVGGLLRLLRKPTEVVEHPPASPDLDHLNHLLDRG